MQKQIHGLRVTAVALFIAIAGATAAVAPVAATDPAPVESPAPTPSADPSASVDPSAAPAAPVAPTPVPTSDPNGSLTTSVAVPAPARASLPNLGLRVVRIALAQRGDQYRAGGQGPYYFDCSGLVRYAYRKAGVSAKLGGGSSARGMLSWGRIHGLTSSRNPRIGDVAIYGGGTHAGIWMGNGRVIQALNPRLDIRVLGLHAVTKPFTTFIHTRIPRG